MRDEQIRGTNELTFLWKMQERLWKQAAAVRLCQEAVRFDRSRLKHVETRVTPSFRNEEPVADVVVVSEEAPTVSKRGGKPDSKAAQAAAAAAAAAAAVASKARVVAKAVAEAEAAAAAAAAAAAKGTAVGGASAMDIGEPFFHLLWSLPACLHDLFRITFCVPRRTHPWGESPKGVKLPPRGSFFRL